MPLRIDCPSCRKPINVGDALIGKAIRCPHCQVVVPGAATQATPTAAAPPGAAPIMPAPVPPPAASAPAVLDVLPAGPADYAGPMQQKQSNTALIVVLAVFGVMFVFCMVIVVCLAAIQFLGQEASVTFSTVGSSIEWEPR